MAASRRSDNLINLDRLGSNGRASCLSIVMTSLPKLVYGTDGKWHRVVPDPPSRPADRLEDAPEPYSYPDIEHRSAV